MKKQESDQLRHSDTTEAKEGGRPESDAARSTRDLLEVIEELVEEAAKRVKEEWAMVGAKLTDRNIRAMIMWEVFAISEERYQRLLEFDAWLAAKVLHAETPPPGNQVAR